MNVANDHVGLSYIFPALVELAIRAHDKPLMRCGHADAVYVTGGVEICTRGLALAAMLLKGKVRPFLEVKTTGVLVYMVNARVDMTCIDHELLALEALKQCIPQAEKLIPVGFIDIDAYSTNTFVVRVH